MAPRRTPVPFSSSRAAQRGGDPCGGARGRSPWIAASAFGLLAMTRWRADAAGSPAVRRRPVSPRSAAAQRDERLLMNFTPTDVIARPLGRGDPYVDGPLPARLRAAFFWSG